MGIAYSADHNNVSCHVVQLPPKNLSVLGGIETSVHLQ